MKNILKGILRRLKYFVITTIVLGGVLMHFTLAALYFSDGQATRDDTVMERKSRSIKKRAHKAAPRPAEKRVRKAAKGKIASGKISGIVRGRGAPMAGNPVAAKIIAGANRRLGVPYVWGGTNPKKGFDCSGLTQFVYREAGIVIPRVAREQFDALRTVKEPMPGDLVFFSMDGNDINHVGIYAGNGRFIHAPQTGDVVKYSNLNKMFWRTRYLGAGAAF